MTTRAVIDIGSNSLLLLIGEVDGRGAVTVHEDRATVTRMSRGASETGHLDPDAVARTLETLERYRARIDEVGAQLVVAAATEGVRMASDAGDFLARAGAVLGTPVRVLSGDEEAALSYRSVAREAAEEPLCVLDVGGASTEVALGQGLKIEHVQSLSVGSVRLTEAHLRGDPPASKELDALTEAVDEAVALLPPVTVPRIHGLAGTITTLAAVALGLDRYDREAVDNTRLSRQSVVALRDELARETVAARARRPCLPPGRADVIVAGLTIVDGVMRRLGAEELVCRDRGHRYALLAEAGERS